jgi:hypothetical protein
MLLPTTHLVLESEDTGWAVLAKTFCEPLLVGNLCVDPNNVIS